MSCKANTTENYKCDKATCTCIPTAGKPCICVCENEKGDIVRCDDCKCLSDNCQCKCNNAKCTCIVTKGAECVCVCRNEKGNLKTCECACTKLQEVKSCMQDACATVCHCSNKNDEQKTCATDTCANKSHPKLSYFCGKAGCTCIPTDGKPCICICENEKGDIVRCDDCKCSSDNCQCKCDDAKCTCIVTKGAECVCVCRDEKDNFKTCDCACTKLQEVKSCKQAISANTCDCCKKYDEKKTCATDTCATKSHAKVMICKDQNYSCEKAGCTCIPTGGKPCICVCENEKGDIVRCDDCKCSSDNCQCKCDDAKCTCIITKGAECVCVCRDEKGNFKTCDCACTKPQEGKSCKHAISANTCDCCNKNDEKKTCATDTCATESHAKVMICKDQKCEKACISCEKAGCTCIPTGGKPCICVCENEKGDIVRCDDCKCLNDNCQCKCDDAKCTCIVTEGPECVCVCRDEKGNFKTCDCACTETQEVKSCKQEISAKTCDCCKKNDEKKTCATDTCATKSHAKVMICKDQNYSCEKAGCTCIPTGGKPCICVCENEKGDIVRCDDCKCSSDNCQCKCDDAKCTCIVTKGAECVCVCRDEKGNFKTCDCACIEPQEVKSCKQAISAKTCDCCKKNDEKKTCATDTCATKSHAKKPCICICENEKGDIVRCDDCKCSSDNCQCKCDDAKCTCIVTKGAECVCVCRDERGN